MCGDRCFQDYGIQILSCSSALARVSVYICVSAYCCICVPACCYKSCDVPRLFHGRVSHTSSYYTTMCVSLMMLPYVCPHATTNLVMFSFFALGCSDGQTRQLSNDLRGLLSFFFYLFFLFSFSLYIYIYIYLLLLLFRSQGASHHPQRVLFRWKFGGLSATETQGRPLLQTLDSPSKTGVCSCVLCLRL